EYGLLSPQELDKVVVGIDRGVVAPVATSDGMLASIPDVSLRKIERKERHARRLQRKMAKQQKGSKNRAKTRQRIAHSKGYGANVRKEFAHQISHQLVCGPGGVFVFEDLKLK